MWLANEAMMTRPLACEMIFERFFPTSASEGVKLGFWAFVESDIMRSTPILLNFESAPKSVCTPSMGV